VHGCRGLRAQTALNYVRSIEPVFAEVRREAPPIGNAFMAYLERKDRPQIAAAQRAALKKLVGYLVEQKALGPKNAARARGIIAGPQ
jgi:hypothetical protein